LVVFTGLSAAERDREALRLAAGDAPVVVAPFRADFAAWLAQADLSVGRAGNNTCAALLATRRRAVLVPDPGMSDQAERARRFASGGLATVVAPDRADAATLARAFAVTLAGPAPVHDLDLDGARASRRLIEAWARAGPRTRGGAPAPR
jgi:predicted glycosyltransferase